MKILLVGGAGDIGKHLIKNYSQQGHAVTVLDKAPLQVTEGVDVEFLQGTITDKELVNRAVRTSDVVVHLAWSFADDAETIFGEDLKGHGILLEAAASEKVKSFIYTSTATVYGRAAVHPVTESHPSLIGDARKPLYALGKYAAEELCKLYYAKHRLPITVFRFWWAFGESIGGSHLKDLVRKAINHQALKMVEGAGGAFLTMSDLGRAIMLAVEQPAAAGQVYNLGSLFLTWKEIGETIRKLTNSKSPITFVPSSKWRGPAFLNEIWDLEWSKAERELHYRSENTIQEIQSRFAQALQTTVSQVQKEGT